MLFLSQIVTDSQIDCFWCIQCTVEKSQRNVAECFFCHNAQSQQEDRQPGDTEKISQCFVLQLRQIWRSSSKKTVVNDLILGSFYDEMIGWPVVQMMRLLVGILYSSCLVIVAPIIYPNINQYYLFSLNSINQYYLFSLNNINQYYLLSLNNINQYYLFSLNNIN